MEGGEEELVGGVSEEVGGLRGIKEARGYAANRMCDNGLGSGLGRVGHFI